MDMLVVQSKVKDEIRRKGCNCSGDLPAALSKEVAAMLDRAAKRAKSNGRKTVRAQDL